MKSVAITITTILVLAMAAQAAFDANQPNHPLQQVETTKGNGVSVDFNNNLIIDNADSADNVWGWNAGSRVGYANLAYDAAGRFRLYSTYSGIGAKETAVNYADNAGTVGLGPNFFAGGSGTLNYVAKWTPDGTHLGNSIIYDNGASVGIGTTLPDASLTIQKATGNWLSAKDPAGNTRFQIYSNHAVPFYTELVGGNYDLRLSSFTAGGSGGNLIFMTGSGAASEKVRIDNTGNVGIGIAPLNKLDVNGNVRIRGKLSCSGKLYTDVNGDVQCGTDIDTDNYVNQILIGGTNTKTITLKRTGGLADLTASFTDIDTDTDTDNYVNGISISGSGTKTVTLTRTGSLPSISTTFNDLDTDTDTNNYPTSMSVTGTTTKTLTLNRNGLSAITTQWTDLTGGPTCIQITKRDPSPGGDACYAGQYCPANMYLTGGGCHASDSSPNLYYSAIAGGANVGTQSSLGAGWGCCFGSVAKDNGVYTTAICCS
jgi:hypothetical protein